MRTLNSLIVPKYIKGETFGLFGTLVCCKISKNLKVGPFEGKKIEKVAQCRKKVKESHSAEKMLEKDSG